MTGAGGTLAIAAARAERIVAALTAAGQPLSIQEIGDAIGESKDRGELCRSTIRRLIAAGAIVPSGQRPQRYALPVTDGVAEPEEHGAPPAADLIPDAVEVERVAVDEPDHGHAGIDDPDVLDEIEAEKVWTCAAVLRAANTAWGIDMGIDADVREARALMEESRRQVRERAPLGQHYREGDPI